MYSLQCVPLGAFLAFAAAVQTGAVDERIHHRVGHPEEKYPDEVSVVDMRNIHKRVDDERHLATADASNDIISLPNQLYVYHPPWLFSKLPNSKHFYYQQQAPRWVKNTGPPITTLLSLVHISENSIDFTGTISKKFAINRSLKIPSQPKCNSVTLASTDTKW